MTEKKYHHTEEWHTVDAGKEIIPVIMDLLSPKTMVDVGCGIGTFTSVFKENGAEVLGVDGPWCDKELLFKNIDQSEFLEVELEKPFSLDRKFDLVVCLEVAEHLTPGRAKTFVQDLTKLGDVLLFSAAIPHQGGENHHNEQWPDYWEQLFNEEGFEFIDCLRPIFWENEKIFYWYKQNIFLVKKKELEIPSINALPVNPIKNLVHPELLETLFSLDEKNALKRSAKQFLKTVKHKFTN